jgi:hypothetical protein
MTKSSKNEIIHIIALDHTLHTYQSPISIVITVYCMLCIFILYTKITLKKFSLTVILHAVVSVLLLVVFEVYIFKNLSIDFNLK